MSTSDEPKNKTRASSVDKDKEEIDVTKVHSANSWETADLGDDERRKKFLKLMGASKSEHQGRFIIGEKDAAHKHTRDKKKTEEIEKELEEQYKHTFEHRITKWSHKGLGFDDEKKPEDKQSEPNQSAEKPKDSEKGKESDSTAVDQSTRKRESTETAKNPDSPPKKPKMMMNFVKSSD